MKKIIFNLLFVIYVIVAVFVTVCLLSFNQFKVTEFGHKSLVIAKDNYTPQLTKGSLLIVDKDSGINNGDEVFAYNTYNQEINIVLSKVTGIEQTNSTETTYTLEGDRRISGEYVLGNSNTTKAFPGVGTVLSVLESRWGFLFIIVLPSLLAFIYQISVVVTDIRNLSNKGKVSENENEEA